MSSPGRSSSPIQSSPHEREKLACPRHAPQKLKNFSWPPPPFPPCLRLACTLQSYEVSYDTDLNAGRTLSATVNPEAGSGEIEYVDESTFDGTLTANIPLGGSPSVTFKRSFGF